MSRAENKAVSRAMILKVARTQFIVHGYALVSLRDIAKAAGRSTGAIFNSFESKGALWREVMGSEPPTEYRCTELALMLRDIVGELEGLDAPLSVRLAQLVKDARALVPRRD